MKMGGGGCVGITVARMGVNSSADVSVGGAIVKISVGISVSVGADVTAGVQAASVMAKTVRRTIQK